MLRELHISNLAVIEDVAIELADGLNCFTGQTGAGKSLILGAFEILLGLKPGQDMLRPGADEARVSGVFDIRDQEMARQLNAAADLGVEPGDDLLITRKIFASGRTSVSVNGQPATAGMVRAIGELLVDIHGQHDHQYLLKPSNQLHILDSFGDTDEPRERFTAIAAELRDLARRHDELSTSRTLRRQQLELYEFQANEIDEAATVEGEYEELKARHALLSNLRKIKSEAGAAHAALYESEGSVVERLQVITQLLMELAEIDGDLAELAEQVRTSTLTLQDAGLELGRYSNRLDLDPAELAQVEDRLNTLNRLVAKYTHPTPGQDPVAALLAYRQEIGGEIGRLRGDAQDLGSMTQKLQALRAQLAVIGGQLTKARQKSAQKLRPLIEEQLRHLGMNEAQFDVEFTPIAPDDATTGLDGIEMLVRTNPGQPARPLRKIASGGELSRIMLAIKSILAGSDRVSVLVFDEIDANVGGRMGTVIGQKLRQLATPGNSPSGSRAPGSRVPGNRAPGSHAPGSHAPGSHAPGSHAAGSAARKPTPSGRGSPAHQVLCITHLPQIAAFANRHLRIAKAVEGTGKDRQTRTSVTVLAGQAQVEELAEMLAGKDVTETTRKQVRELLQNA